MKQYQVKVTPEAKEQLRDSLAYIRKKLKNPQAAKNFRDDYKATVAELKSVAGNLAYCEKPYLAAKKLKKIHFRAHDYVMLFRVNDGTAEVVNLYHDSQDYENY